MNERGGKKVRVGGRKGVGEMLGGGDFFFFFFFLRGD